MAAATVTADNASDLLDVVIVGFRVSDDAAILAGLQRVFKMDETNGRRLLDNLPNTIARKVPLVRARYLGRALNMIQAEVEVRDQAGKLVELPAEAAAATPRPAAASATRSQSPPPAAEPTPAPAPAPAPSAQGPAGTSQGLGDAVPLKAPAEPTVVSSPNSAPEAAAVAQTAPRVHRGAHITLPQGQPAPGSPDGPTGLPTAPTERPAAPATTATPPHVSLTGQAAPTLLSRADPPQPPQPTVDDYDFGSPAEPANVAAPTAPTDVAAGVAGSPDESTVGAWGDLSIDDPSYILPPPTSGSQIDVSERPDPLATAAASLDGQSGDLVIEAHGAGDSPGLSADAIGLAATAPESLAPELPEAGQDIADPFKDFVDRMPEPPPEDPTAPAGAPAGFMPGSIDLSSDDAGSDMAGPNAVADTDGNLELDSKADDHISLAPSSGASLRGKQPLEVLTDHEQPTSASIDNYRHPVGRSGDIPRGDSPLAPAAHPGYQPSGRPRHDMRPFWATMGEGMMLPFMGTGTAWIIAISLWSACVGGTSILFKILPGVLGSLVAGLATVGLFGSVIAFAADYHRTCMWTVLSNREAPDESPSLERIYGEYLGSGVHFLLFAVVSYSPLIFWTWMQPWDDGGTSTRAFLTSPITIGLVGMPHIYFPMALGTAALGNRTAAIWQIGFGTAALFRVPLEYSFIVAISAGATIFSAAGFIIAGAILEMQGPFFLAAMGFPIAIGCGIQGGLMGHLMRARPEAFEE